MIVTFVDITEQKQIEQALKESEGTIRALLDASTESAFLIETDGTYVQMNEVTTKRLDKDIQNLLGKCAFDFLPSEIAKSRKSIIKGIVHNKKPVQFQDERAGRILDNSLHPIIDSEGNVVRIAIFSRDITAQKQAEESLRTSEEKYKLLAESSTDAIYKINLENEQYSYASPSAEKLFGYTNKEILGLKAKDCVTPESYEYQREKLEAAILQGKDEPEIMEMEVLHKDGRVIPVEVNARILFNKQEFPVEIFGIARDITWRKEAEQAHRESENKFRYLVELTSDWIWEVDNKGHYTYASPKCETLLGYKPEDIIGKTPFHLMPAEEAVRVGEYFRGIVAGCESFQGLENINIHKDGHNVVLETSGVPFFDEAGDLSGYRGIDRDITERKQFEEKLKKSEERYRFLAENMADIVFTFDMGMNPTYVSPSIKKVLGFTPDERKQQSLEEMVTPDSLERLTAAFVAEIERDKQTDVNPDRFVVIETENFHKDGSIVWLENIVKAIRNKKGHMIGIYGAARNITNRKSVESKLKQEKMRLEKAITEIKKLSGLLPICASCKKIRDDQGYWNQIESYIRDHSEAEFSHSICPECVKKLYPDFDI